MSEFRFCCSFSEFCQLAYPRRYRDQPTPDLIALRDAYKADVVQPYPGLTEAEIECHIAITQVLITELEHELALRRAGGVDIAAATEEARRYPPAFVQAVRDANNLVRLIAEDIGQAPKGTVRSSWMIRSPFRHDASPSFAVYPDGHWFDHGTHEWGDAITYIMRRHDVDFSQAIQFLAVRAGVPIPEPRPPREKGERWSARKGKRS